MSIESLVFALTKGLYDYEGGTTLRIPQLDIYSSATIAAAIREGIDIVEGDLFFYGSDGTPLRAKFSKKPYINSERKTYFSGTYSLQAGSGHNLQEMLSMIITDGPSLDNWIVVHLASTDDLARKNGWSNVVTMKNEIEKALKILPLDIVKRIKFEWGPAIARVTATRH